MEIDSGVKDILHNLVDDLLVMCSLPEWPAAEAALAVMTTISVCVRLIRGGAWPAGIASSSYRL